MRYIILVLLNLPVILLGLVNIITQYKLKSISHRRFKSQLILWLVLLVLLIGSFPVYNYLSGKPLTDSSELSLFDVVQTTAIVVLIYIVNTQRRHLEKNEKIVRELHQEISIKLSENRKST